MIDLLGSEAGRSVEDAMHGWTRCEPIAAAAAEAAPQGWLLRGRAARDGNGGLLVIIPDADRARVRDPRIQVLLDHRGEFQPIIEDHSPVVVIEGDLAVRRLLASQLERIGAICYPADDIDSALRLFAEEPRLATILLDAELAGSDLEQWIESIRARRPETLVIAIGGAGIEEELKASGITRVLPRPWRLVDLLDAMTG